MGARLLTYGGILLSFGGLIINYMNKIHTGRLDDRDRSAHFVSNMQATLRPDEEMTRSTRK